MTQTVEDPTQHVAEDPYQAASFVVLALLLSGRTDLLVKSLRDGVITKSQQQPHNLSSSTAQPVKH